MNFEFASANRVLFGPGTLREVGPVAVHLGNRTLLVTGSSSGRASSLVRQLELSGVTVFSFNVPGEPTLETVRSGVARAKENGCGFIVAFGGGSAIDAGKAIAALLPNEGDLLDYLEVIGKGRPLAEPSLPCIAIPTTAGTGSEVTRNAVLTSVEHGVKVSLRSPHMLPRLAVVDPELCRSLPPSITAATGIDALTQLIEPYVCNSPNPLTDALCREGIRRVAVSLRRACLDGDDLDARADMSLASLFSGMALANARLGAVHGLAGPLGGALSAPHGAICARLLPFVMEANLKAIEKRAPGSPALARYSAVARLLTGNEAAGPVDGVLWLRSLCSELEIPALSGHGLSRGMIPALASQAMKASSMKGNPVELTELELTHILEQAM
ncbi:MAG TPA: iron-containing alcohol dehydrogenase [Syntrophobacteraceae bacterium]|nr:iron-containing alcohol dehydrogenase [Syntrophobacteraceae bacterium]